MTQARTPGGAGAGSIASKLRQQVEQLTYLPASASVAVKFIELGKDPEVALAEYEKTISSDAALGTKILALANSSWFGVRQEVKKVLQAITLLGLANVRTLGISYCMAGLYNQLKIPREEVKRYWQASLCKGVAARAFLSATDPGRMDEAFLAGLFQDMALPLMHSVAQAALLSILQDPDCPLEDQLQREREVFGVDHAEAGRWIATRLELPEAYADAIGFHHDPDCLFKFVESEALASAVQIAAMLPHLPGQWNTRDVSKLHNLLSAKLPHEFEDQQTYLNAVEKEFSTLYGYFESGQAPDLRLADVVADACQEVADSTTRMAGQMRQLMKQAAETGQLVQNLVGQHERLVDQNKLDVLTGALNRAGFVEEAARIVELAGRHAIPFAVLYGDIDGFKDINDSYGHVFGDFVLRESSSRILKQVRKADLLGRLGGDEFVIILYDIKEDRARAIGDAIVHSIRDQPFVKGKIAASQTMSLGILCVPGSSTTYDLMTLLEEADGVMYQAKRSGKGQLRLRAWKGAPAVEPA